MRDYCSAITGPGAELIRRGDISWGSNAGQVVGYSTTADGEQHATLWEPQSVVLEVTVDIKPSEGTAAINLKSKGVIPVTILSTTSFDATMMDVSTIRFGDAEACLTSETREGDTIEGCDAIRAR